MIALLDRQGQTSDITEFSVAKLSSVSPTRLGEGPMPDIVRWFPVREDVLRLQDAQSASTGGHDGIPSSVFFGVMPSPPLVDPFQNGLRLLNRLV
jgi:hypothetical protein